MNFDSYDEFLRSRQHAQQVSRLKVPYRGGDIYTDNRHRFVRKLQRPQWLSGPFIERPMRASSDRWVILFAIAAALFLALAHFYGLPV